MSGIMEYALKMGNEAYKQEQERSQILRLRVDYLFKWLTLFISVFNIMIPLLTKEIGFDYTDSVFIGLYILLMILALAAMIIILSLNYPKKIKRFPTGCEILKIKDQLVGDSDADINMLYQQILLQTRLTQQLSDCNDKAVESIRMANFMLVLLIIVMMFFYVYMNLFL